MARDAPTEGKIYRLTGGPGVRAISNGNSWAESEVEAMSPSATATAVEGAVPRRQYERQYGARYDRTLTTTEIAKRFREDVKAAQAAGDLPLGLKVSVTTKYFSGGSSIHVVVKAADYGTGDFFVERVEAAPLDDDAIPLNRVFAGGQAWTDSQQPFVQ